VIVIDPGWDDSITMMATLKPAIFAYVTHLLQTEYREVYNHGGYRILVRHSPLL